MIRLKNWCLASLGDVAEIINGKNQKQVENPNGEFPIYGSAGVFGYANEYLCEPGSTVIGRKGTINNPIFVNEKFWNVDTAFGITPYSPLSAKYLYYYFTSFNFYMLDKSTTIPSLAKRDLLKIEIPISPLNEQHRIVAKIEELFSELDKGVESLKKSREQLKVYRQAVLKHAFEGKLTEKWRAAQGCASVAGGQEPGATEENKTKLETADQLLVRIQKEREARYQQQLEKWNNDVKKWEDEGKNGRKPTKPRIPKVLTNLNDKVLSILPFLPQGWCWEKLGWMTLSVEYGTSTKSSKSGAVPVIRMGNIQNAKLDWTDLVYTSDKDEIEKYLLSIGDVLFNRTNSPEHVGKTAIYDDERTALFAGYLIRVNHFNSIIDSKYLNLFLNSVFAKQYGNTVKTDGVNQSNINGDKLINYPFPYCSLGEQKEIIKILEEKISVIDENDTEIRLNLKRAEVLRQAILKKAFSGQLVEQDPNDEPASVLLERIKAEKEKQIKSAPKKKRIKKRKTAA